MIASNEEFDKTQDYANCLSQILLSLRAAHSPQEYEAMSRAYLKELTKAQREIALFLATPQKAA